MYVDLDSLIWVLSSVYITPTHTCPLQEIIVQDMQQKVEKSYFPCKKNTWHGAS